MEDTTRWYFTKEVLASTPSRKNNIDANKELSYRQQAANFIQDMGQRLQVTQLCINTAIVYMHRFYVFHSFAEYHRDSLSVAALFLGAKVEEQPRKLEHVIKVAHMCLHKDATNLDVRSEAYIEKHSEVVALESMLLQSLGFMLAIEHPHTYVVKVCQLVKASKDLAQTSYFMATTSLHMTTMCLQFKPTVVACVCIHLACKWSNWKIEPCSEGKEWFYYVDKSVTLELLESLTEEYIAILETSPHRFKRKFIPQRDISRPLTDDSSKHHSADNKNIAVKKVSSPGPSATVNTSQMEKPVKVESSNKRLAPGPTTQSSPPKMKKILSHPLSLEAYREKKEKERLEQKSVPPPVDANVQQPVTNKPQHAFNDYERVHKHPSNSLEPHSHSLKMKPNKDNINKEQHLTHPASMNKANHHFAKKPELSHSREGKGNLIKLPSSDSSGPVVLVERFDAMSGNQETSGSEVVSSVPSTQQPVLNKLTNAHNYKYASPVENVTDSKESFGPSMSVANSPATVPKLKHQKHKTNSLHSNHNTAQPHPHKQSPAKDIKTNGSKEVDPNERRNASENSVVRVKTPENLPSKHEKREKHKIKHSSNSKDKFVSNHSEQSNPAIKVKIRKDIICLSESSQKSQAPVKQESSKKTLKIRLPKPPVSETGKSTNTSIKLVITKDKSGSGNYCTSHKNDRESRKRVRSPSSQETKHIGETPSKSTKLDHTHSSHPNLKQSKTRHSSSRNMDHTTNDVGNVKLLHVGKESTGYHNVDVESYTGQPYYGNQYFSYQASPPPPPPSGYRGKTNFNLSVQPPPPPTE